MITDNFDPHSAPVISPKMVYGTREKLCDVCVVTFSHVVIERAAARFDCTVAAQIGGIGGDTPIYLMEYKGRKIAFYQSQVGSAAAGAFLEEAHCLVGTEHYVMFGSCGCLDRSIPLGTVLIPTEAYRDEGLSYHYAPPADYIAIRNAPKVAAFFEGLGVPIRLGRTWITDAIYRETAANVARRKAEGCITVEMECSALQAVCDFKGLQYYAFFINGDLLDGEAWDRRIFGSGDEMDHQLDFFLSALDFGASL